MSDAVVTLVTGAPRSGTSLAMQMLGAGGMPLLTDDRRAADADNPRGYFELAAVRRTREDASWLAQAGGRAVKVVHALLPWLPADRDYRVIDLRRAWPEVLCSQRCMLARRGERADAEEDQQRLAALLEAQREAAERWARRARGAAWLRLDYAEIVAEPHAAARRLAAFAGGSLDTEAMAAAVDPALYRQRLPRTGQAVAVS
jgi:hypothetical protein